MVANENDFQLLLGGATSDLEAAMTRWAKTHRQTIIVTLGADGATGATEREPFRVPAPPVRPVDTVGAGDTFTGYLAAGFDQQFGLEVSLRRATVAASLACLRAGAQPSIPAIQEVEQAAKHGGKNGIRIE